LSILTLITGVFKVLESLLGYAERKQLMDAGEARAVSAHLVLGSKQVEKAIAARRAVDHTPSGVSNDPNNRD
tara:strand:+ start:2143 stop:2358 length:216 start_codon:yes stop_codon:yes gene_type:complete